MNQRPGTEAHPTEVVPTAEDILDASAAGGNGTSSKVSRADALTDEIAERMKSLTALMKRTDSMPIMNEWQWLNNLRNRLLAASPVEQHEAAPADEAGPRGYNEGFNNGWERGHVFGKEQSAGISEVLLSTIVRAARKGKSYVEGYGRAQQFLKDAGLLVDPRAEAQPEPQVADERAAFDEWWEKNQLEGNLWRVNKCDAQGIWKAARASSPNAAGAEGAAELASMTRMFHAACHDLGLINEALGLDPDDGGAEPILDAIAELKAQIAPAQAAEPVAIPAGYALVPRDPAIEQLTAICETYWGDGWDDEDMRDARIVDARAMYGTAITAAPPPPAPASTPVGLTDEAIERYWKQYKYDRRPKDITHKDVFASILRKVAQEYVMVGVTDEPHRKQLAALIDIYDDERNNAPEDRCYVEGAWTEALTEARALLEVAKQ
ncbi:hypothetical protein CFB84_24855 [Burkholderia aenigmatica]|uniref:Uncharacterized protein n=2 Tax=Burkholderia aenigmatica TaxID=2015348 RepID=A0A228IJ32_9BURK|nr:hypothetical protein CFB84_24855 [Burkholderia aenigmatica]